MFYRHKTFNRLTAHPLGRRIRTFEGRVFLFQFFQLPHQSVILSVADDRVILHVVLVVMGIDFPHQFRHPLPASLNVHYFLSSFPLSPGQIIDAPVGAGIPDTLQVKPVTLLDSLFGKEPFIRLYDVLGSGGCNMP